MKITNEEVVAIKKIESITFDLNINDRKIINIIHDVKYVLELNYNLISTDLLKSKNCEIVQRNEVMIIVDLNDDEIFMIDIRQKKSENNFYILDQWHSSKKTRIVKSKFSLNQWHRRLNHLNIKYVKQLTKQDLLEDIKFDESIDICEFCQMSKMHRKSNRKSIRS